MWVGLVALVWFVGMRFVNGELQSLSDLVEWVRSGPWMVVAGALVLLGLAASFWSWWTTRYIIDGHELRVERRGLSHESTRVAYRRIQSIDLTQPFAARLLGLARLEIDVSGDRRTHLAYFTRDKADALRVALLAKAQRVRQAEAEVAAGGVSATPDDAPPVPGRHRWDDISGDEEVLIRLPLRTLLLGTVLGTGYLVGVLITGTMFVLSTWFGASYLAIGGAIPFAIAVLGPLANGVLRNYHYALVDSHTGLKITKGATTLRSQSVPVHRVQSMQISQPLLWRLLGTYRINISISGMGSIEGDGEGMLGSVVLLPIGNLEQMRTAVAAVWPGLELDDLVFEGPPERARWLNPVSHRWLGWDANETVIAARTGALERTTTIVPHARVLGMDLNQGPLQRRLRVVTVLASTAAMTGMATVAQIDERQGRALLEAELDKSRTHDMEALFRSPHQPTVSPGPEPIGPAESPRPDTAGEPTAS